LDKKFEELFGRRGEALFFAPGRVNLIGEYTDISGGHALPCALARGTYGLAARRDDGRLRFHSLNFAADGLIEARTADLAPSPELKWAVYPAGVVYGLRRRGLNVDNGLDALYWGDLPQGAGLSSSASIEVLTAFILNDFFDLGLKLTDLALVGREAENDFVGLASGIMDQFASALGRAGRAILLNCGDLNHEYRPFNYREVVLVIADTLKRRALTESKYNQRREECETALASIRSRRPVTSLCDLSPDEFGTLAGAIDSPEIVWRARHVISENQRTLEAAQALSRGDLEKFGLLLNASHRSLKYDFEVTGPELDALAEAAQATPGVLGSRMTGAGFGGCTVNLVYREALADFQEEVAARYEQRLGRRPAFYPAEASAGVQKLEAL
jgi:galactokinase